VHPDAGLSTGDAEEAAVKRALHERAAETIVLASVEKLMAASPFLVTSLSEISLLMVRREPTIASFMRFAQAVPRLSALKDYKGD
jgi:DeoR/GlpR family transcriptional regulator of sugar metabolism